jgi:hypothetical protein
MISMSLHGHQLAADLSQLRIIGTIDLPALGYTYSRVNNAIAGTAVIDVDAFGQPGGGGGMSQAYPAWTALRDDLQNHFGQAAADMHAAATVMLHIVDAYIAADTLARDSLAAAWQDGGPPDGALDSNEKVPPPLPIVFK